MKEQESEGIINESFKVLNEKHNNIYNFVIHYHAYISSKHDYGNGIFLTMMEIHTLTYIEDHPGINISQLAKYWNKTKGALSQTVSRLADYKLVEKNKSSKNAKNILLFLTEEGKKLSQAHKLYDVIDITKTLGELKKECSSEEIEAFYKVIKIYNKIIKKEFKERKGKVNKGED